MAAGARVPRPTRPTTGSAFSAPWTVATPPSRPGSAGISGHPISEERSFEKDFRFAWLPKGKKVLGEREAKAVLAKYGILSAPERQAKNADEAVKAATELGYPVVLKADGDIEHKTEAGAVKLDLRDAVGAARRLRRDDRRERMVFSCRPW